jgi:filamentous hemagglutinin
MQEGETGKGIPGVDRPFRDINPEYPPNASIVEIMNSLKICEGSDCSEIASILKNAAGSGQILTVTGQGGSGLRLLENGEIEGNFTYHQVFTDGRYVYDPRLSSVPVPLGDWSRMIWQLNPGAIIK